MLPRLRRVQVTQPQSWHAGLFRKAVGVASSQLRGLSDTPPASQDRPRRRDPRQRKLRRMHHLLAQSFVRACVCSADDEQQRGADRRQQKLVRNVGRCHSRISVAPDHGWGDSCSLLRYVVTNLDRTSHGMHSVATLTGRFGHAQELSASHGGARPTGIFRRCPHPSVTYSLMDYNAGDCCTQVASAEKVIRKALCDRTRPRWVTGRLYL